MSVLIKAAPELKNCHPLWKLNRNMIEKNEVFHRFGYDKLVSSFQQRKINNEIDDQSNKRKAIIKQRKDEQIFLSKLENEKANWVKPKELKKIGKYPPIYSSNRQELCETLNYFKSYHSGHYVSESRTLGYLLDGFPSPRDEFEDFGKVIISHGGGGSKTITLKKKLESQNQEGNDDELFNDRFGVEFIKSQERNNYRIKSRK
ncbi:hypothetical protein BY996DRAFT_1008233 [Phakopsora pachyrhizi]|nr:hypothetical protein BY996DRAFT_1008233 [Phakopsora pachyrhizi]